MSYCNRSILLQSLDVTVKLIELDKIMHLREKIILENEEKCIYKIKNTIKLKKVNKKIDQIMISLGKIIYRNSNKVMVQSKL